MYSVIHNDGKFSCITRTNSDGSTTCFTPNSNLWQIFLNWNSQQITPLSFADYPEGFNKDMIPNYAALASEINSDPLSLGYTGKTTAQQADLINASTQSRTSTISINTLLQWAAGSGVLYQLQNALNTSSDAMTKSICQAALIMLSSPGVISFDLGETKNQQMLGYLQSQDVMTADNMTSLTALGTIPCSRAEVLWGNGILVTAIDIQIAIT